MEFTYVQSLLCPWNFLPDKDSNFSKQPSDDHLKIYCYSLCFPVVLSLTMKGRKAHLGMLSKYDESLCNISRVKISPLHLRNYLTFKQTRKEQWMGPFQLALFLSLLPQSWAITVFWIFQCCALPDGNGEEIQHFCEAGREKIKTFWRIYTPVTVMAVSDS